MPYSPRSQNPDQAAYRNFSRWWPVAKTGQIKLNDFIVAAAEDGKTMTDVVGWSTREIVSSVVSVNVSNASNYVNLVSPEASVVPSPRGSRYYLKQEESGVTQRA
jgi:carboxyl-terminal processing protease